MDVFIILIVVLSSFANIIADLLLVSGRNKNLKKQSSFDIAKSTSEKNIKLSAIIGAFAISLWLFVLFFLKRIEGKIGLYINLSYALFIISIVFLHISWSKIFLLAKHPNLSEHNFNKKLILYIIPSTLFCFIFSGLMIYVGVVGILKMTFLHYLLLPMFSVVLLQLLAILKIKYLDILYGSYATIAMLLSMLSIIHLIL